MRPVRPGRRNQKADDDMTDTDIVSEYCALAGQAAFDDARLDALRERMTGADIIRVKARLRAEGEAQA